MDLVLTAVFEKDEDWWIASIQEIPGIHTQGKTLEEAKENIVDALQLMLETNRELAEHDLVGKDVIRQQISLLAS